MNAIKNQVQLIGHLGKDPELKTFDNNNSVVRFTLATNEVYKDQAGEKRVITQWHTIVAWGKMAQNIFNMAKKGNEMAIQGKLTYREYTDSQGVKKYMTEVVANEFFKINSGSAEKQAA